MGQLADSFLLSVDVPLQVIRRPRLARLILGALVMLLAATLLGSETAGAHWRSLHVGDARIAGLILLLVGVFHIAQSMLNDHLHVHTIRFSRLGMHLSWSHVPNLLGLRNEKDKLFSWDDLDSLMWIEGNSEHDLKQHLKVEFKERIGLRRNQIKILVSDDRNAEHCEKLLAFLPEDFIVPEWLKVARKSHGRPQAQA